MATIYLFSTYEDLKDYRRTVFDALRKSGYDVIAMEDYVATDRRPVKKCLDDVARADLYVGLLAFRYGYVPPLDHHNPEGLSITELELRQAEKLGKPCLIFAVSEDAPWPPKFIDSLREGHINRLRDHVLREKMVSFFAAPHELSSLVQAAVTKCLADRQPLASPAGTSRNRGRPILASCISRANMPRCFSDAMEKCGRFSTGCISQKAGSS